MSDRPTDRRTRGYHALRVRQVVQETDDTRSFVLEVPVEHRDAFRYRAGQFCTFRVRIDGQEHLRCYSMSSAPETDDDLTVTVKRMPGGLVSNWLNDHVGDGDVVEAAAPGGVFCVDEGHRPVIALCGGSGVTPVMSIAKSVLASTQRPVRLLYANRDRSSVIFRDQLAQLGVRHPERLDVHHHLDAETGLLDAEAVTAFVGLDLDADVYICGPAPFMDLVETTLLTRGVDPARIFLERFEVSEQPVPAAESGAEPAGAGTEVPESVTVILKSKRHTIPYQPGDTVLETARRGGLQAPFSCEAGNCASCMAIVHEGSATMRVNDALTPDEVDEGLVLTCQALPQGPTVTIEYESF